MEGLENEKIAGITPDIFGQEPIQCDHNSWYTAKLVHFAHKKMAVKSTIILSEA
jgi:phosphoglycerate dehydrogenase-like enzyme